MYQALKKCVARVSKGGAFFGLPSRIALLSSMLFASSARASPADEAPNFLIIMPDDLGYGDLSHYGGETPTPNMDRLFEEGIELSQFMVAPICSPARAGLLTGLNPSRTGDGPQLSGIMPAETYTFGRFFQDNGYVTGLFGKWHNSETPRFFPEQPHVNELGFDRFVGFYGGGADYFTKVWPNRTEAPSWYHDETPVDDERDYKTDLLTDYAIEFIETNQHSPFVCYVPFSAPHTPLHASQEYLERVPQSIVDAAGGELRPPEEYYKLENDRMAPQLNTAYVNLTGDDSILSIEGELTEADWKVLYSAMLIALDDGVGRILDRLDALGLADNTVVLFFSDDGAIPRFGSNDPFRGGKHTVWEGGVRVPAAIRWPDGGLVGPGTFEPLIGYLDVLTSLGDMAGLSPQEGYVSDGRSFWPELLDEEPAGGRNYYFLWRHQDVIRTDDWKLFRYHDHFQLYDMQNDYEETTNLAEDRPDIVADLLEIMEARVDDIGAAPSHVAPTDFAPPSPLDRMTEVTISTSESLILPISTERIQMHPGDHLHFQIMVEQSPDAGFYLSPIVMGDLLFEDRRGMDQYGRLQADRPMPLEGVWEHRVIGLGNMAPRFLTEVVLNIREPGAYHFYIADLEIHRKDGSVIEIPFDNDSFLVQQPPSDPYRTGFESEEGWATGSLGVNPAQQPAGGSWDNTGVAQVQDFNPHTGDYSVYFNSANIGNHTAHFTPNQPYTDFSTLTISYYAYFPAYPEPDGDNTVSMSNNHRLELVTDATTLRLQFDNFDTAGNPGRQRAYIQDGLGAGGENGLMNQVWESGEWMHISFTLDFVNNTYSYRVDSPTQGLNVISDQDIGHDISQLEGVNLIHRDVRDDTVDGPRDLTMFIDDFSVTAPLYRTGFEAAEGWLTGSLDETPSSDQPSGGTWDRTGVVQVQDYNPYSGDYSVYFNSESSGNHEAIFTPDPGRLSGASVVEISYYAYLPDYPMADYGSTLHRLDLYTDAHAGGDPFRLQVDNFGTDGNPERHRAFISRGLGEDGEIGLINQVWAPYEWTRITATLDFESDLYSWEIDSPTHGVQSVLPRRIGHEISDLLEVRVTHRDVAGTDRTLYVDDFSITAKVPSEGAEPKARQSYAEWLIEQGVPEGSQDPGDDPFGTGVKNLEAYATGLSPQTPERATLALHALDNEPVISMPWRTDISPDTYFRVESSPDLAQWQPDGRLDWKSEWLDSEMIELRGRIEEDPMPERKFYRIRFGSGLEE